MGLNDCHIAAQSLDGLLDDDDLAVNVVAELFKGFSDLDVVDRTENGAVGRSLCADGESYTFK